MPGASRAKVPAGFIDLLREMVLAEREAGREVIVELLREREAFEWERMRDAKGAQRRVIWWNLKRIVAFMMSVDADDEPAPGERRLTPEEFEQHFGWLPTDGEG